MQEQKTLIISGFFRIYRPKFRRTVPWMHLAPFPDVERLELPRFTENGIHSPCDRENGYKGKNNSYPRLEVVFGGHDNFREPMVVEADEFIAVKGFKAKGKRLTTYTIETINELEPTRQPEPSQKTEEQETDEEPEILDPDHGKSEGDILDEMTGQMKLF